MGGGSWTTSSYSSYATSRGYTLDKSGVVTDSFTAQERFTSRRLNEDLNIKNKIRECCDSAEHPNTIPVILGLDVTGSMGNGAVKVAKTLNKIMTDILSQTKDVEFSIMAIGDIEYDNAPIQMSQFESDIRIAEHLDKVYFEGGGGGNQFESYSIAWYAGLHNCKLDCWNRGRKGIIITLGDEPLNPVLGKSALNAYMGSKEQADVDTKKLYQEASQKFDIYHLAVDDESTCYQYYKRLAKQTFTEVLPEDHYKVVTMNSLPAVISEIVTNSANEPTTQILTEATPFNGGVVSW